MYHQWYLPSHRTPVMCAQCNGAILPRNLNPCRTPLTSFWKSDPRDIGQNHSILRHPLSFLRHHRPNSISPLTYDLLMLQLCLWHGQSIISKTKSVAYETPDSSHSSTLCQFPWGKHSKPLKTFITTNAWFLPTHTLQRALESSKIFQTRVEPCFRNMF